jgi:hypothetical protein
MKMNLMKILFAVLFIISFGCNNSKSTTAPPVEKTDIGIGIKDSLPVCVSALIEKFKSEEMTNPPIKIYRYMYKGKNVYYTSAPCCDNFSDLYNDSCRIMGHPDGGFTGRGDGKLPDFKDSATMETLLWEDPRGKKVQ